MMDRLSSFLIRRLHHVERRSVRRLAVRNGLLKMSTAIVNAHIVGRFTPAFDASHLTGDTARDYHWVRGHLASFLIESTPDGGDRRGAAPSTLAWPEYLRRYPADGRTYDQAVLAKAVGVVAAAGSVTNVKHLAILLMVASAMNASGITLRNLVALLRQPAPVLVVQVFAEGFERALPQLIENTDVVPFGPYTGVSSEFAFVDDLWLWENNQPRRVFLQIAVAEASRPSRASLRGQLLRALANGTPVLAVSESHHGVPDQVDLTCDVRLIGPGITAPLIADLLEAVYGLDAVMHHTAAISNIEAEALTLDDLAIAIRPGRPIQWSIDALRGLSILNREHKKADVDGDKAGSSHHRVSQSSSERNDRTYRDNGSERRTSQESKQSNSKGTPKDKSTGAEVIQPEQGDDGSSLTAQPVLRVETLTGYGAAKDWALALKLDLADYLSGNLPWSQMSTKLLLSGPPGTGKTTFAKALCNTLQIPLVVTSVSTWLQGEYLHDVLDRLSSTFAEARAHAPCILFIDEIDGIGQRAPASRSYSDYWNACVNKLLELLDGATKTDGVIVVGATNRPDQIDEAIRRSGRLETHIEIPRPDIPTLAGILAHHLGSDLDAVVASNTQIGGDR
ncbi:AAA family ATPase [Agrobacterium sp. DKPNP3]|uniref:AAA family ATPase n=1 Tax=Agrobacterium sp. DKPNP3 TaxID=3457323 RepID=UPI004043B53A